MADDKQLKVYEINVNGEKNWIAAYTNIHALKVHESITDMALIEFTEEDFIEEVPKEKWPYFKIKNEDGGFWWLSDHMENLEKPELICSTVY